VRLWKTQPLRSTVFAVAIATLMVWIAACLGPGEEFHVPKISNLGDQTIVVYVDSGGVVTKLATVAAGTTVGLYGFNNQCTHDPMVAKTLGGRNVASRTDPICPDEFWAIEP
jgi:hypothetical protein